MTTPVNGQLSRECRDAVRTCRTGAVSKESPSGIAPGGQATQFDSYGDFDTCLVTRLTRDEGVSKGKRRLPSAILILPGNVEFLHP